MGTARGLFRVYYRVPVLVDEHLCGMKMRQKEEDDDDGART